jgi:S-adenosylmethionine decarboxylase
MLTVGTEWLIEASGCDAGALRDVERLRGVFARAVRELDLRVVGEPLWHKFPGEGGATGLVMLTESHLACHTYPEFRAATFNLYCCRERPAWPWAERLREMLGAETVSVRAVRRWAPAAGSSRRDGPRGGEA